jgi:hypothetical protein
MATTYRIFTNLQQAGVPLYSGLNLRTAKSYVRQLRARGFADAIFVQEV